MDYTKPIELSLRLNFSREEANPNAFGLPYPTAEVAKGGDFIGDTRQGGSCNCETIRLNPHGNGTHTECVGHISTNRISIADVLTDIIIPAQLVSVEPEERMLASGITGKVISATLLQEAVEKVSSQDSSQNPSQHRETNHVPGLIIRTLPNDLSKGRMVWTGSAPPSLDADAMRYIRSLGINHLLVDLPSVDPEDDPLLTAHRIFWDQPLTGPIEGDPTDGRTITEMIYAPNELPDGHYKITIQIPPFALDAAPSRVLVLP